MPYDTAQPVMFDQAWQQDALISSIISVLPTTDETTDVVFINATGSTRNSNGTVSIASIGGRRLLVTASAGTAAVEVVDVPQRDVADTVFALKTAVQDDTLTKAMQANGLDSVTSVNGMRYAVNSGAVEDAVPFPAPTPVPAPAPAPEASNDSGSSTNVGLIVGIVVAAVAVLAIIAIIAGVVIAKRRSRNRSRGVQTISPGPARPPSRQRSVNRPALPPVPVATPPPATHPTRTASGTLAPGSNDPISYDVYRKAVLERQKSGGNNNTRTSPRAAGAANNASPRPVSAANSALSRAYGSTNPRGSTADLPEIRMTADSTGSARRRAEEATLEDRDEYYRTVLRSISGVGK